jgi:DNA polymerase family A
VDPIAVNRVKFPDAAKIAIRAAATAALGEPLRVKYTDGDADLAFDLLDQNAAVRTLGPKQFHDTVWIATQDGQGFRKGIGYPNAQYYVQFALKQALGLDLHMFDDDVLIVDTETHGSEHRWNMAPRDFFRLGQYAWGEGDVVLTQDFDEVVDALRSARLIIGHQIHSYDLSYLLGDEALDLPVFDTLVHATCVTPAPDRFLNSKGVVQLSNSPSSALAFHSLENSCFTFGIPGKHGNLKEMAKRYGCEIGEIPINDEYEDYARQDVIANRELARAMFSVAHPTDYEWREQEVAAINAQISRNGFRVDRAVAEARVQQLQRRKDALLVDLVLDYGFPTKGKQPWRSSAGKQAILDILGPHAVKLAKTKKKAPSLSGDSVKAATEGTELEELGETLGELLGQRSLAQLALDNVQDDDFVHPDITSLQRSRRFSVSNPGLSVWTAHGPGAVEKSYFVADDDDHYLYEMDFAAADARVVAAYSGDRRYLRDMTDPKFDAHAQTAQWCFGARYANDPREYRQRAKPVTHSIPYGAGGKRVSETVGISQSEGYDVIKKFGRTYPSVARWMERSREEGKTGTLQNAWGGVLYLEPGREYTQSPALFGQNGTRELLVDGLIRCRDAGLLHYLKITVHDAVVFSFPKDRHEAMKAEAEACFTTKFREVPFPLTSGLPAPNWYEAGHEA